MKLAYDEAIVLVDNIIYYLKTFGVPALKAALEYIKEMQCELGEMVYRMLHKFVTLSPAQIGQTDRQTDRQSDRGVREGRSTSPPWCRTVNGVGL